MRIVNVRFGFHRKGLPKSRSTVGNAPGPQSAYTFIEMMVAGGLLAFMIFSLYSAFSFGFTTIALSQENVRADQILVQKLETLRIYDWNKINSGYIPSTFTNYFSTNGGAIHGVTYTGTVAIASLPLTETYSNTLRQVTVSVGWMSAGIPRTRSMTTLVSEHGIQTYKP